MVAPSRPSPGRRATLHPSRHGSLLRFREIVMSEDFVRAGDQLFVGNFGVVDPSRNAKKIREHLTLLGIWKRLKILNDVLSRSAHDLIMRGSIAGGKSRSPTDPGSSARTRTQQVISSAPSRCSGRRSSTPIGETNF